MHKLLSGLVYFIYLFSLQVCFAQTPVRDSVTGNAVYDAQLVQGVGGTVIGNNFTKSAAIGWNAGVSSQQTIDYGYGYVEFTVGAIGSGDGIYNTAGLIGLGSSARNPNFTSFAQANVDHAIGFRNDGLLKV